MVVSEKQRAENAANPRLIAKRIRRGARETARENVVEAVREVVRAGPPEWFRGYQAAAYQAELTRLLSRI